MDMPDTPSDKYLEVFKQTEELGHRVAEVIAPILAFARPFNIPGVTWRDLAIDGRPSALPSKFEFRSADWKEWPTWPRIRDAIAEWNEKRRYLKQVWDQLQDTTGLKQPEVLDR
jgi:hypothetical protein